MVFVPQETLEELSQDAPLPDDDPYGHAHYSPYAARARAAAYLKQAELYEKNIAEGKNINTLEHILDTLRIYLDGETTLGCTVQDTFTVSRMPIPHCIISDTGALFGKDVLLWTRNAYCDDDEDGREHDPFLKLGQSVLNVDFEWQTPFYGDYASDVTPHTYGEPALLPADRYNTVGHPWANAENPYYVLDTVDGDTVYFPVTIQNNDPRDPIGCAVNDTVAVTIYRGHHINGYISYNGFWHPSDKGITRPEVLMTPDVAQYDEDAGGSDAGRDGEHMAVANVKLYLYKYDDPSQWIDTTHSDEDGLFAFEQLAPSGQYFIVGTSPQKTATIGANGVTANDAAWTQQYAVGAKKAPTNPLSMWWYGSNVDLTTTPAFTLGITSNDAAYTQQRAVGAIIHFSDSKDVELEDWAHSNDTFMLEADTLLHLRSIMRGDANRDYIDNPMNSQLAKAGSLLRFDTYGDIEVEDNTRIIDYPILSISEGRVMAFQLFMPYDASEVEILGITSPVSEARVVYNFIGDELLFNWIRTASVEVHEGDTLAMLKILLKHKPKNRIDRYFRIDPIGYEVTLSNLNIDPDWQIALPELALFYYEDDETGRDSTGGRGYNIDTVGYTATGSGVGKEIICRQQGGETDHSEILSVIPNPVKTWADITYSVYGDCLVSLRLYTLLGEEVMVIVNSERQTGLYRRNISASGLAAGVYVLRLETIRDNYMETDVIKVVVQK